MFYLNTNAGGTAAAVYKLASRFNASCRPNCAFHFATGGRVVIRSLVGIVRDEPLTLAYVDLVQPSDRQAE